jgi:hypothetical protein
MFGWFKKKSPPPALKRCSQCDTEMDADESVCPQCGHGAREARERRDTLRANTQAPAIDMSDLAAEWAVLPPSARRQMMRSRLLGTDRSFVARLAKRLGIATRPAPPPARRVAARAMVLAGVVGRAVLEMNREDLRDPDRIRQQPFPWLKGVGIARELEPRERDFLRKPIGRADRAVVNESIWRVEGLAVLAWALNRFTLPAYDEAVSPVPAQASVGFGSREVARELLDSGSLRPSSEIERFATHATLVTWRLRQFRLSPGPWDFVGYLRRHASFREAWLEDLRIVDGDLALGAQSIANAPAEKVQHCERIALERHIAAYWLQGDDPTYSKVDPTTLLSAC